MPGKCGNQRVTSTVNMYFCLSWTAFQQQCSRIPASTVFLLWLLGNGRAPFSPYPEPVDQPIWGFPKPLMTGPVLVFCSWLFSLPHGVRCAWLAGPSAPPASANLEFLSPSGHPGSSYSSIPFVFHSNGLSRFIFFQKAAGFISNRLLTCLLKRSLPVQYFRSTEMQHFGTNRSTNCLCCLLAE